MTEKTLLTPADAADCDWIVERHRTVYSAEFGLNTHFGSRIAARMDELRARRTGFVHMLVARIGGERAGFICVSDLPDNGAFINFVWVETRFRRRGVAEALMQQALDHARQQGCSFVRLRTFDILESARRLYARFGFEIAEIEKDSSDFGPVFDVEFWEKKLSE